MAPGEGMKEWIGQEIRDGPGTFLELDQDVSYGGVEVSLRRLETEHVTLQHQLRREQTLISLLVQHVLGELLGRQSQYAIILLCSMYSTSLTNTYM